MADAKSLTHLLTSLAGDWFGVKNEFLAGTPVATEVHAAGYANSVIVGPGKDCNTR